MNRFDEFCNLILEAYAGKQINIPPDGRPAADRYNNPGGAYPSKKFEKYGMEGYGIIGGGHPIAKYPTLANGIAANIAHLKSMPVVGKTVGQARHYWVYGNFNGSKNLTGMDSNQVITKELLNDPNWLAQWMKATAADEGFGNKGRKLDDNSFAQAMDILKNNSNLPPASQYDSSSQYASTTNPQQSTSDQPPSDQPTQNQSDQNVTSADNDGEEKENKNPFSKAISDIYAKAEGGAIGKELAKQAYDTASNVAKNLLSKYGSKLA